MFGVMSKQFRNRHDPAEAFSNAKSAAPNRNLTEEQASDFERRFSEYERREAEICSKYADDSVARAAELCEVLAELKPKEGSHRSEWARWAGARLRARRTLPTPSAPRAPDGLE